MKLLFTLFLLLFISGCASSECAAARDCPVNTCERGNCDEGKCSYDKIDNCCGNNLKDTIENGKPGNECTCPLDYGKCEGPAKIIRGTKETAAQYAGKTCVQQSCQLSVDPAKVLPQQLTKNQQESSFTLDSLISYNLPTILDQDSITFSFTLQDRREDFKAPLTIKRIQLLEGEKLFGQLSQARDFSNIADNQVFVVPVNGELSTVETQLRLTYKVDYEYRKQIRGQRLPDGSYQYTLETVRDSFSDSLGNIAVVDAD